MTNEPQTASRSITVAIRPQGKGRGRAVAVRNRRGQMTARVVTPSKTRSYEQAIAGEWFAVHGRVPITCPCKLMIHARFAMPKSWSAVKRVEMLGKPHTFKPDLDNVIKTVDALNGLAFADDSQIAGMVAIKQWAERDEIEITVDVIT